MSRGLIKTKYRKSKYGAETPRIQGDITTLLVGLHDRMIEAAMTLRRAEQAMASGSPSASEELGAAATGFARAASFAQSLPDAISSYINQITSGSTSVYWGIETFNFAGGVDYEEDTVTVTGETWVVSAAVTPVFAFTDADGGTSDVLGNLFDVRFTNFVAGDGFDMIMRSHKASGGLPGAASFTALWVGLT
jgi:hypothetical protein